MLATDNWPLPEPLTVSAILPLAASTRRVTVRSLAPLALVMLMLAALVLIATKSLLRSFKFRLRPTVASCTTANDLPVPVSVASSVSTEVRKATLALAAPLLNKKLLAVISATAFPPRPITSVPPCRLSEAVATLMPVVAVVGSVNVPVVAI